MLLLHWFLLTAPYAGPPWAPLCISERQGLAMQLNLSRQKDWLRVDANTSPRHLHLVTLANL
jgi:hypothetical protein